MLGIENLCEDNFDVWKMTLELLFEKKGIDEVVSGVEVKSEEGSDKDKKEWKKKDSDARYCIVATLDKSLIKHIQTKKTAKEMWDTLVKLFESDTTARVKTLQKMLINMKLKENQKVVDYIAEAKLIAEQLRTAKNPVSDNMLITMIVDGLPTTKFSGFMFSWNSKHQEHKTLENLETELISAEEIVNVQDEEIVALTASASKTKISERNSAGRNNSAKEEKQKFTGICYFCKQKGHRKFECPKWSAEKAKFKKNPQRSEKQKENHGSKSKREADNDDSEVFIAEANYAGDSKCQWVADSGASFHMANDKLMFDKLQPSVELQEITLGDYHPLKVIGKDDEWKPRILSNVYCVPSLKKNLFSYSACTKHGYEVVSTKDKAYVKKNDRVSAEGDRVENLYQMAFG